MTVNELIEALQRDKDMGFGNRTVTVNSELNVVEYGLLNITANVIYGMLLDETLN